MSEQGFEFNKKKSPYQGIMIVILFLLGFPFALYKAFQYIMVVSKVRETAAVIEIESRALAGGIGTIVCFMVFSSGGLAEALKVVTKRISEFFFALRYENLIHALKWYWQNVREKGLVLWIYLLLIGINVATAVIALRQFLKIRGI